MKVNRYGTTYRAQRGKGSKKTLEFKVVKPLFSEKVATNENTTQVDNSNIISPNIEIAKKLNIF